MDGKLWSSDARLQHLVRVVHSQHCCSVRGMFFRWFQVTLSQSQFPSAGQCLVPRTNYGTCIRFGFGMRIHFSHLKPAEQHKLKCVARKPAEVNWCLQQLLRGSHYEKKYSISVVLIEIPLIDMSFT